MIEGGERTWNEDEDVSSYASNAPCCWEHMCVRTRGVGRSVVEWKVNGLQAIMTKALHEELFSGEMSSDECYVANDAAMSNLHRIHQA